MGFLRGLLESFLEGYRGARPAGDAGESITWTGVTIVRVGTPIEA